MIWISNNDPPLYVWLGDMWYNQKDRCIYHADMLNKRWLFITIEPPEYLEVAFPKKTRVM